MLKNTQILLIHKQLKRLAGGGGGGGYKSLKDNTLYGIKNIYFHKDFFATFTQYSLDSHLFQLQDTKDCITLDFLTFQNIAPTPPHIDYIIFIDSDDYWEKDCLIECLNSFESARAMGVETQIVWFDLRMVYDNIAYHINEERPFQTYFKHCSTSIMDSKQWIEITQHLHYPWGFAHAGMIDFEFFVKTQLYYTNRANWEDVGFGIMLFVYASAIFMLNKQLYVHRARDNSISRFEKSPIINVPPFLQPLDDIFHNPYLTRKYHKAVSAFFLAHSLALGIERIQDKQKAEILREHFFTSCLHWAFGIFMFPQDPLCISQRFVEFKPYVKGLKLGKLSFLKHLIIAYPQCGKIYGWIQRLRHKDWLKKI
ncbi:hypothetical protein [Helicobacter cinaedi]|uniref:hypothetical protein n=1 Tax=Helicobacter cinaedi TaxID=213 RepID=UPI000CF03972|nr:hypothetical protein [Helicobacter cinaedi]QOQ96463.1 hypothetical protein HW245_01930 [Helicobacter cinaedi]